ncbi:hypothetical protein P5P81_03205 [Tritonibacter mobilis]|nr:hypothetical protein [Tritonibacter mobilis]
MSLDPTDTRCRPLPAESVEAVAPDEAFPKVALRHGVGSAELSAIKRGV